MPEHLSMFLREWPSASGILVPSRNTELLGWCLANGLTIVQQSTLMTTGLYNEPTGAWLPSIAY